VPLGELLVGSSQLKVLDGGGPFGADGGLGDEVQQQDARPGHGVQMELQATERNACCGCHQGRFVAFEIGSMVRLHSGCSRLPVVLPEDVSHVDIYRALGILEGKLDAVVQALNQRNRDFETALKRISDLEKTVAKGLGVALTCSFVLPLVIGVASALLNTRPQPAGLGHGAPHPGQPHGYRP
jgi:hypothetical protein